MQTTFPTPSQLRKRASLVPCTLAGLSNCFVSSAGEIQSKNAGPSGAGAGSGAAAEGKGAAKAERKGGASAGAAGAGSGAGAGSAAAAAAVADNAEADAQSKAWWQRQWDRILSLKFELAPRKKLQSMLLARDKDLHFFLDMYQNPSDDGKLRDSLEGLV
jgi:hypothetical protein